MTETNQTVTKIENLKTLYNVEHYQLTADILWLKINYEKSFHARKC